MKEGALHELPGGWVWTSLEETCFTTSGGTPSRKNVNYFGGNIPWLKSGELNNGIINSAEEAITEDALKNSIAKIIPKGTLLIALYGATVGKLGILGFDSAINQAVCAISTKNSVDQKFLFWYLNSYRNKLLQARVGGAQPNISQQIVNDVQIPLPPLSEQQAIVSKIEQLFSDLDNGIENFKKAQAQLKLYRQSVLKAACEGKLVPTEAELACAEGRDYEAADVLLARIKEEQKISVKNKFNATQPIDKSDLPELPNGWVWTNTEGPGKVSGGLTKNSNRETNLHKMPYLRVANVYAGELLLDDIKDIGVDDKEIERVLLEAGDLLIVEGNGSIDEIGRATLWNGSISPCVHQNHIIKVRFNPIEIGKYVSLWLLSKNGRKQVTNVANSTSGLYTLNISKVSGLPIPLPPLAEQRRIVAEVERRLTISDKMEEIITESLQKAESLRQSILKKAFEGKLLNKNELEKARNAPDWEPAEKLLERIRQENQIKENNNKPQRSY